ncbi:MAG: carboxypeptidase M32 [Bradymonadaceae bacterium]
MTSSYEKLEEFFGRLGRLGDAIRVLGWDGATMMPAGGAEARGEQIATLKVMHHGLMMDPRLGDWLMEAEGDPSLDVWQQANVREMKNRWIHDTAVPAELVEEFSRAGSQCETVWRTARKDNDFPRLATHLQKVLELTRRVAGFKGEALGCSPYDALLDTFEPGASSERIDVVFDDLAEFLPPFLEEVLAHQERRGEPIRPPGPFAADTQKVLAKRLMTQLGFDFNHGRLDTSLHPFCGGVPDDVRITTTYHEDDFLFSLMAVLHETGHALYERGLPSRWRHQPVGNARGMSMHESQSLLVEMQASRSSHFVHYLAPLLREAFGGEGKAWEEENLYRLVTRVERGLIRVDADEVTYPAHVILRYRLEKKMIEGSLDIADLPEAWNEAMGELIGVVPPDDRDGCMQDIHWMDGAFGYFPTYTLGALTAAQLFHSAANAESDVIPGLERGDFNPLMGWMKEHVHEQGCLLSTDELLTQATGQPLDPSFFKAHLRSRYLA